MLEPSGARAVIRVEWDGTVTPAPPEAARAQAAINTVIGLNGDDMRDTRRQILAARRREITKLEVRRRGLWKAGRTKLAKRVRKEARTSEFGTSLLTVAEWLER